VLYCRRITLEFFGVIEVGLTVVSSLERVRKGEFFLFLAVDLKEFRFFHFMPGGGGCFSSERGKMFLGVCGGGLVRVLLG